MTGDPAPELPDQALLSALEFAVGIAAAGAKLRPPLPFPAGLKRFLRFHKLPAAALSQVRAAVEADPSFRGRLASVATPELVDAIGVLWLTRPDGWARAAAALIPVAAVDDETAVRREERRRQAAQDAAARVAAELLAAHSELARERANSAALAAETARLLAELDDLRQRLRTAQRADHASAQAVTKLEAELATARRFIDDQGEVVGQPAIDDVAIRGLLVAAAAAQCEVGRLLAAVDAALGSTTEPVPQPIAARQRVTAPRRRPLPLPGGVMADSAEGVEFVLRAPNATTLVDGYNVAKLAWPSLDLGAQREQCVRCAENLAKRWNVDITVVFDGADVQGGHATSRRRLRVVYSPAGVTADDVLRQLAEAVEPGRPVVVVTNDKAIIRDVRRMGANVVSSDCFVTVAAG